MSTLYELTNDLLELLEIEDQEGQTKEIIEVIDQEIKNKGTNLVKTFRHLESDVEVIDQEIKRLQQLKKQKQKQVEKLKKYVLYCMDSMDKKKIETPLGNLTTRKSKTVEIIDEQLIPTEFKKEVVEIKIDKIALKKELQEGVVVEGATLKENVSLVVPKIKKGDE